MAQTRTKTTLSQSQPELAAQWHPTKNGSLTPEQVVADSHNKAWWMCTEGPDHEWEVSVNKRSGGSGCPFCNHGWIVQNVRLFVKSLIIGSPPVIEILNPADLYLFRG